MKEKKILLDDIEVYQIVTSLKFKRKQLIGLGFTAMASETKILIKKLENYSINRI